MTCDRFRGIRRRNTAGISAPRRGHQLDLLRLGRAALLHADHHLRVRAVFRHGFLAPDPAQGQALWAFATAAAELMTALLSPVLGAIADASGRASRGSPASARLVIGRGLMRSLDSRASHRSCPLVLIAFGLAIVGAELATVFNNAMMTYARLRTNSARLSGTGWATGYVGGLVSLVLVAAFSSPIPRPARRCSAFSRSFRSIRRRAGRSSRRSVLGALVSSSCCRSFCLRRTARGSPLMPARSAPVSGSSCAR